MILAGGIGQRMKQDIPKQFLNVYDKPVIIYTLECFQHTSEIDEIMVICLQGWENLLRAYANQFNIDKLKWIVPGGASAQESIRNGVFFLRDVCDSDDIVIIHESTRPMVDAQTLSNVIEVCKKHGSALSAMPYYEEIFTTEDGASTNNFLRRECAYRVNTPQAYRYDKLINAYERAFSGEVDLRSASFVNTLLVTLGERLYFADGSEKNIKLTTRDDFEFFKTFIKMDRDIWLK